MSESRDGHPGLPVPNKPDGFCGGKAAPGRTNITIFACCTAQLLLMNCYIKNKFCLNQSNTETKNGKAELRSWVKVEVAVLGSQSPISLTVFVAVKQQWNEKLVLIMAVSLKPEGQLKVYQSARVSLITAHPAYADKNKSVKPKIVRIEMDFFFFFFYPRRTFPFMLQHCVASALLELKTFRRFYGARGADSLVRLIRGQFLWRLISVKRQSY